MTSVSTGSIPRAGFAVATARTAVCFFGDLAFHIAARSKKTAPKIPLEVHAFMTAEPNALTASINHELMPVLRCTNEQFEIWLRGSAKEAFAMEPSSHELD